MVWARLLLISMLLPAWQSAAQPVVPVEPPSEQPSASERPPARPSPSPQAVRPPAAAERPLPDALTDPAAPEAPMPDAKIESAAPGPDSTDGGSVSSEVTAPVVPAPPPAWLGLAENDFSHQSCLLGLSMLGVSYAPLDPITSPEDPDCGIAQPLNIAEIQPGISIAGDAIMRCDTARSLALWVRNDATASVRHLPGAPRITEILPGSTYQCRARVGGSSDKLSEHALGNAFDVSGLRLSDGSELTIAPRNDSGEIAEAVEKALRYTACLQFSTVLGPGSNAAHDDHLHFDIAARRGGWRLCE